MQQISGERATVEEIMAAASRAQALRHTWRSGKRRRHLLLHPQRLEPGHLAFDDLLL